MQNKNRNLITILTFVLIMLTTFAYSALATSLSITGEAMFRTPANIRVSNITLDEASGATNEYEPKFTKDTITTGFTLNNASSSISYTVRITNNGLRDQAIYNLITQSSNNSGLSILINGQPIGSALPIIVPYQDYRDITITYSSTSPGRVDVVNRFDFREVYYISYNTKGGSSVATQTKYKNVDLTLAGTPTKSGYRFLGWTDEQNGEVVKFEPGDTYTIDGDNKILYAIYELNVAEITLSGNVGGTEKIYQKYNDGFYLTNNNGTLSNKMTTSSNPITVPQKDGYKFEGYYTQANGQGTKFIESNGKLSSTASSTQFNANSSLYAYYTPYKLTINYYANGAQKDNGTTINNQKLTTDTYDYDGTDLASTGLKNYDGGTGATWNLTKTGYTASKYYHIGSANNNTKVHENTNYAKIQDLATAMNKGEDLKTSDVEVNIYAGWTANTYQVSFNANGGTGTMSNQSFTYGTAQNLTANAFTRSGYTFIGWNTLANGNGNPYLNSESVNNLTTTHNAIVDLYAQWIKNGSVTITGVNKVGNTLTATVTAPTPIPTNYTYQWYRGSTAISGATSSTYTPVDADIGSVLKVVVTANYSSYNSVTFEDTTDATNNTYANTNGTLVCTNAVAKITGNAVKGSTLAATVTTSSSPSTTTYSYQWYRGSTAISGATSSTYTTVAADVGKTIKVVVTAIKTNYVPCTFNDSIDETNNTSDTVTEVKAVDLYYDNTNTGMTCETAQCALDNISRILTRSGARDEGNDYLCRRATSSELHTGYGQVGTAGTLSSGDAFICDVNGDGTYNAENEMFYYVSDYYDTSTQTTNSEYATLVFYNNMYNGEPYALNKYGNYVDIGYKYYSSAENWHGPSGAIEGLPSTMSWQDIGLYKNSRAILAEYNSTHNSTTTSGGTLPTAFSYKGASARLLTAQELMTSCGLTTINDGNVNPSYLNDCLFFLENTVYQDSSYKEVYWLETPLANSSTGVAYVNGKSNTTYFNPANYYFGIRPAIDVKKTDMLY